MNLPWTVCEGGPASGSKAGAEPGAGPFLGVLGGMGPLATVDFLVKLIKARQARLDQEHVPVVVVSDPRLPDRCDAILTGREEEIAPWLESGLDKLLAAGAGAVAIPCNTAHFWHGMLQARTSVPILHIAEAAVERLKEIAPAGATVTVLGTPVTASAAFYHERLADAGFDILPLSETLLWDSLLPAIARVKVGDRAGARESVGAVEHFLDAQHVDAALLACSELPIAFEGSAIGCPLIDTNRSLAAACVRWWEGVTVTRAA